MTWGLRDGVGVGANREGRGTIDVKVLHKVENDKVSRERRGRSSLKVPNEANETGEAEVIGANLVDNLLFMSRPAILSSFTGKYIVSSRDGCLQIFCGVQRCH